MKRPYNKHQALSQRIRELGTLKNALIYSGTDEKFMFVQELLDLSLMVDGDSFTRYWIERMECVFDKLLETIEFSMDNAHAIDMPMYEGFTICRHSIEGFYWSYLGYYDTLEDCHLDIRTWKSENASKLDQTWEVA
jgi:hypothetical protein